MHVPWRQSTFPWCIPTFFFSTNCLGHVLSNDFGIPCGYQVLNIINQERVSHDYSPRSSVILDSTVQLLTYTKYGILGLGTLLLFLLNSSSRAQCRVKDTSVRFTYGNRIKQITLYMNKIS